MRIVLDTHAWVWWVTEDRRLSKSAARAIKGAAAARTLWLSPMSVWEVAKKVEKQQLTFDRPVRDWVDLAMRVPGLLMADLSPAVLVESCSLPQPFHGDPADQIIVATARHLHATLVTRDERLRAYEHVPSVW